MKAAKIVHRSETRIRVDFGYNAEWVAKLRQIPDTRWSKTMKAWHIPYTKEAFAQLKQLFPDVEYEAATALNPTVTKTAAPIKKITLKQAEIQNTIEQTSLNTNNEKTEPKNTFTPTKYYEISIEIFPKNIFVKMPKNEADIQFIRSFKYARWNKGQFMWSMPNFGRNMELLKTYFGNRKVELVEHKPDEQNKISSDQAINQQPTFTKNDFLVINNSNRVLKLYFSFNKNLSLQLKQIPYCSWNADKRCWEIPYSEKFLAEVKAIAEQHLLNFIYHEEKKLKIKPRTSKFDVTNYRTCPQNYIDKLLELRYSQNTLDVYTDMFEEFINHYEETSIDDITEPMIMDFLRYLVIERHVSTSYQNQSINAIYPVGFLK